MIFTRAALEGWRTVRRYAVPAPMIRRATERRIAGDWRGACAAADVAADVDLPALAGRYGAHVAATIEDDLRHLAPDLLRWHLPRRPATGQTTLSPRRLSVLARYGEDGPVLCAGSPRTGYGRQRLRLFVAEEPLHTERAPAAYRGDWDHEPCVWYQDVLPSGPRHRWDARRAGELLTWYGLDHVPGFDRAGRPAPGPGAGAGTMVEDLHDAARFAEAWHRVGVEVAEPYRSMTRHMGLGFWCRLPQLVRAVRQFGAESGTDRVEAGYRGRAWLEFAPVAAERLGMTLKSPYYNVSNPYLPLERLGVPLDALLLHLGHIAPDDLHPLVHAALFPEATAPPAGPPAPAGPEPVRVRCEGAWHEVRMRDGRVRTPHSEEERRREAALVALGGSADGCFAVEQAWQAGTGRLPRRLRPQRRELMLRALHGDSDGVTALLDAGADPRVRDHRGRTLLHFMAHLRDLRLLERLLAAGLEVDARDVTGLTPLAAAVHGMGDVELIRALIGAGANTGVTLESGEPIGEWMAKARPAEFAAVGPWD